MSCEAGSGVTGLDTCIFMAWEVFVSVLFKSDDAWLMVVLVNRSEIFVNTSEIFDSIRCASVGAIK